MDKQSAILHFTNATKDCLAQARRLFPKISVFNPPTILWNIKGAGRLGEARHNCTDRSTHIRFNAAAAALNPEVFADTVPHEVAHIVAFLTGNNDGHGPKWGRIYRALGGNPRSIAERGHFQGLTAIERRTRYYQWSGDRGPKWVTKKEDANLRASAWARTHYGLDSCTREALMTAADFHKARAPKPLAAYS